MLSCLGSKHEEDSGRLIASVTSSIKNVVGDIANVYRDVTLPVLEALRAYEDHEYDAAVEIMKPLKYQLQRISESHAQRDLFNIFTVHSALRSKKSENQKYASHLLMETNIQKGSSPLVERLLQRLVVSH